MRKLETYQMKKIQGGSCADRNLGCASLGLAAGIAAGCNPLVGGLTTFGCMLISPCE